MTAPDAPAPAADYLLLTIERVVVIDRHPVAGADAATLVTTPEHPPALTIASDRPLDVQRGTVTLALARGRAQLAEVATPGGRTLLVLARGCGGASTVPGGPVDCELEVMSDLRGADGGVASVRYLQVGPDGPIRSLGVSRGAIEFFDFVTVSLAGFAAAVPDGAVGGDSVAAGDFGLKEQAWVAKIRSLE